MLFFIFILWIIGWRGGGGGVPNIKVTKSSERNNTTGKQNDWISGLSEYNNSLFPAVYE